MIMKLLSRLACLGKGSHDSIINKEWRFWGHGRRRDQVEDEDEEEVVVTLELIN